MADISADIVLEVIDDGSIILECVEIDPITEFDVHEDTTDPYTGNYIVTPNFNQQTLPTKGKTLSDDVTVKSIPVSRTSNPAGGKTIHIGEI